MDVDWSTELCGTVLYTYVALLLLGNTPTALLSPVDSLIKQDHVCFGVNRGVECMWWWMCELERLYLAASASSAAAAATLLFKGWVVSVICRTIGCGDECMNAWQVQGVS